MVKLSRLTRGRSRSSSTRIYPLSVDVVGDVRIEPAEGGVAIVVLSGEHDLGSLPRVRDAFDAVAGEGKSILIDLCPTSFVDSSILERSWTRVDPRLRTLADSPSRAMAAPSRYAASWR